MGSFGYRSFYFQSSAVDNSAITQPFDFQYALSLGKLSEEQASL